MKPYLILTITVLAWLQPCRSASAETAPPAQAPAQPPAFQYTDADTALRKYLAPFVSFSRRKFSYQELADYYQRNIKNFATMYPPETFSVDLSRALGKFDGELTLTSYDAHYTPFVPIVPEATHALGAMQFYSLKSRVGDKEVAGLKVAAPLSAKEHSLARSRSLTYSVSMTYIPTINARVLGFTHAQLIPELSRGITPSRTFEYNGDRPWSEHARYAQTDQIRKPIELTNHAHSSGSRYDISAHPDFALTATFEDEAPVVMTFYLWKPSAKVLWLSPPPKPESPPDFILQWMLVRPGMSLTP